MMDKRSLIRAFRNIIIFRHNAGTRDVNVPSRYKSPGDFLLAQMSNPLGVALASACVWHRLTWDELEDGCYSIIGM